MQLEDYQLAYPWLTLTANTHVVYEPFIKFAHNGNRNECEDYFNAVVELTRQEILLPLDEIKDLVRTNLGYFAAYFETIDRELIIKYYNAHHPYLPLNCTAKEAFDIGVKQAELHSISKQIRNEINK